MSPLYKQYEAAGIKVDHPCAICGGEMGIHHYDTMQCQKDGVDIIGEVPEWQDTTFEPVVTERPKLLDKNFDLGKYTDQLLEKILGTPQTEAV